MLHILIATLGEKASALTYAFDRWLDTHQQGHFAVVHTSPQQPKIAASLSQLKTFMPRRFPNVTTSYHEITRQNGAPLLDVDDSDMAWDYFSGFLKIIADYATRDFILHVLIAGGRKEMSVYATVAAAAIFRETVDQLWTVHSPSELIQNGELAIPTGRKQDVKLINLPILPARLSDEERQALLEDPHRYFARRMEKRSQFMELLTPAERDLCNLRLEFPYIDNGELGVKLKKSRRTIENQLAAIYNKMQRVAPELGELDGERKAQALMDLLRGYFN
ncbi:MAG: hypothetical protein OHK0023_11950 [Anaerolineae bacterium]